MMRDARITTAKQMTESASKKYISSILAPAK